MKTQSQGEADTSSDDFLINRRRPIKKLKVTPRPNSRSSAASRKSGLLARAASAPGQQKVSDYYFVDPTDIKNVGYLPDLVVENVPPPVCIVISDESVSLEGPTHVSSPASDTQVFDYPNLSPIVPDISCIVIADSDSN